MTSHALWNRPSVAGESEYRCFWCMPLDENHGSHIYPSNVDLRATGRCAQYISEMQCRRCCGTPPSWRPIGRRNLDACWFSPFANLSSGIVVAGNRCPNISRSLLHTCMRIGPRCIT